MFKMGYRDGEGPVRERSELLRQRRQTEIDALPPELHDLYERRWARLIAGLVAVAGACALLLATVLAATSTWGGGYFWARPRGATDVLLLALAATSISYVLARAFLRGALRRRLARDLPAHADPFVELEQLEAARPAIRARQMVEALGLPSAQWPMLGAALLAPLTLHFALYLVRCALELAGNGPAPTFEGFDQWIWLSLILTLPAHLGSAWATRKCARDLFLGRPDRPYTLWRVWGIASLWGIVPGIALMGIPTLIVIATGAICTPLTLKILRTRVLREQSYLQLA
jgi:hypothetical protein